MNKIANRLDEGFNISVRVEPITTPDPEAPKQAEQVESIRAAEKTLQFLKIEGPPLLSLPEEAAAAGEPKKGRK